MIETWQDITAFENYKISNNGTVIKKPYDFTEVRTYNVDGIPTDCKKRFTGKEKVMVPRKDGKIVLSKDGTRHYFDLARLIDFHFNDDI